MKVILLNDVPRVGQKYDVKDVANGYGRNYLLPKGLARVATDKVIAELSVLKARHEEEKRIQEDLLKKNIEDLNGITVVMREKANEKGHLFAGVHKEEIIPALKEQTHLAIESEHIALEHPIKELGEHKIEVKVGDKTAKFTLVIEEIK